MQGLCGKTAGIMSQYFVYYVESSIICLIIFGIMLGHNLSTVDRSEKVVKYDGALIAFMLYFVSDAIWASMIAGVLPKSMATVSLITLINFILMAGITFMWLRYVAAVETVPGRNTKGFIIKSFLPLGLSILIMVAILLVDPHLLITPEYTVTMFYSLFQVAIPIFYIIVVFVLVLRRAAAEDSPEDKTIHIYVGMFPLMVVLGGMMQVLLLPETPIFCYSCAILMIIFYIQMMESRISIDPLTGLNNRGQLRKYTAQENSIFREGKRTYIMMIDVNDFKGINDTYGHAMGDKALKFISDSLKQVAGSVNAPVFIARYGGDEFIFIAHSDNEEVPEKLVRNIHKKLNEVTEKAKLPFTMSVAIGYDELRRENDSFRECLERADQKCYINKDEMKKEKK